MSVFPHSFSVNIMLIFIIILIFKCLSSFSYLCWGLHNAIMTTAELIDKEKQDKERRKIYKQEILVQEQYTRPAFSF